MTINNLKRACFHTFLIDYGILGCIKNITETLYIKMGVTGDERMSSNLMVTYVIIWLTTCTSSLVTILSI